MKKKSKATKKKTTEELPRKNVPKRKKQRNWKGMFMVGALVLVMISFILSSIPTSMMNKTSNNKSSSNTTNSTSKQAGPSFVKEGRLKFLKSDGTSVVTNIDIEVADTEAERNQGLMFRRYMEHNHGMLFVMEQSEVQSFYMRNTHISLDIIYVDAEKTIVSIQKNTVPMSEASLVSEGDALYVVEVNAGYCDQYGIGPGDKVDFELF